jgi:hypothetical protein
VFLLELFHTATLLGKVVIVVDETAFWFAMISWTALLLAIPVLGNRPQPLPNWR